MEERFRLQLGKIMGTSGAKNEACKEANQLLQSILSKLVVPMVVPMRALLVFYGIGVVGCCPHRGRVSGGIWAGLILLNV